ncbi:MAG: hypothetical protein U5P41_14305 [Gammaproteobacteria bacterium]|nr:hypothetical protein [Gammaproteobacteria bacterium]
MTGLTTTTCHWIVDARSPIPYTQTRSGEAQQHKQLSRFAGPDELDGQTVYREYNASGTQRLLQRRSAGIFEVGYARPANAVLHDEPVLLLPQPLTTDSQWQAPVTTNLLEWRKHSLENNDRRFRKELGATFRCTSLTERVRTPAGTFTDVARIEASGHKTINYGSLQEQSVIHVELRRWYAPGVGLIKSERREYAESRELNPGEATRILERID